MAYILYLCVGSVIFTPGLLGRDLVLVFSIWRTGLWFIDVLGYSCSVWLVVMDVGILGLVYCGVRAGTVAPGVLGHNIALAASTWRTGPWFLEVVAWINSVWVVSMDVGM